MLLSCYVYVDDTQGNFSELFKSIENFEKSQEVVAAEIVEVPAVASA